MDDLSTSWKRADFAQQLPNALQLVERVRRGESVPVFDSFLRAMRLFVPSERPLSFLDGACTGGYYLDLARAALPHRLDWTGSDIADAALRHARARHPTVGWHAASLTALPFAADRFDVVMAAGVLEHVPDWERALAEVARVARRYVLLHRLRLSRDGRFHSQTIQMYGVPTTAHALPFHAVNALLAARDFVLVGSLDSYDDPRLGEQTAVYRRFTLA